MPSVPQVVVQAYADIQAIAADGTKTEPERRSLIRARRTQACGDQFEFNFNVTKTVTLTDGEGIHWTVGATDLSYTPAAGLLELFGVVVLRNGVDVGLDPHQQIVNPPLLFPDASGAVTRADGRKLRVDPAAVVLDMLVAQAKRLSP